MEKDVRENPRLVPTGRLLGMWRFIGNTLERGDAYVLRFCISAGYRVLKAHINGDKVVVIDKKGAVKEVMKIHQVSEHPGRPCDSEKRS